MSLPTGIKKKIDISTFYEMYSKDILTDYLIHRMTFYRIIQTNIPINGKDSELGGMLSVTSMRNTVIERSVVTPMDTFSPKIKNVMEFHIYIYVC